jgi:hypothetical protein
MKVFMRNEFLLAVLMGVLVLMFTPSQPSSNLYYDDAGEEATNNGNYIRYLKLFLGTVITVYIILFLLSNYSATQSHTGGAASGSAATTAATGDTNTAKMLNESIEHLMSNIDLNDPTF